MNAVQQLYYYRKSLSTKTYQSRGYRVIRCELCRLAQTHCICQFAPTASTIKRMTAEESKCSAGFLLLMHDTEVLKPSNTGKLIADLVNETYAFLWSRTVPNPELLAVLNDPQWQPFVVFPSQYAEQGREVINEKVVCSDGKRPLFIMLDGSWREAKKMFRKSPYLAGFSIVSFDPQQQLTQLDNNEQHTSRYQIRIAHVDNQFATAEVAARVLSMAGEHHKAHLLDLWFDVFSYQYQKSVCQTNKGNPQAIEHYQAYIAQIKSNQIKLTNR
ncbi:MAG: DTW domain-containing protein YfiP [Alteromonadaceae bacterium]|jgi:DTW domain-containing protein YfiP